MTKKKIAVFISGKGSNLQALIDAATENDFPGSINLVISDNSKASGLNHAHNNSTKCETIEYQKCINKEDFEQKILNKTMKENIDIICLAGFMRILSGKFITSFNGPIINIHPSLLPKYKGLNTHQRAIESGDKVAGCTVHYVTKNVDDGEIILQKSVPILPNDTVEDLAARVLKIEHEAYAEAIKKILN